MYPDCIHSQLFCWAGEEWIRTLQHKHTLTDLQHAQMTEWISSISTLNSPWYETHTAVFLFHIFMLNFCFATRGVFMSADSPCGLQSPFRCSDCLNDITERIHRPFCCPMMKGHIGMFYWVTAVASIMRAVSIWFSQHGAIIRKLIRAPWMVQDDIHHLFWLLVPYKSISVLTFPLCVPRRNNCAAIFLFPLNGI